MDNRAPCSIIIRGGKQVYTSARELAVVESSLSTL